MKNEIERDALMAKVYGLSILVGELVHQLNQKDEQDMAIQAYAYLRRILPIGEDGKRIGHEAAYNATQGK
jgi:hypothetical protein